jgi:hypothetical protein
MRGTVGVIAAVGSISSWTANGIPVGVGANIQKPSVELSDPSTSGPLPPYGSGGSHGQQPLATCSKHCPSHGAAEGVEPS